MRNNRAAIRDVPKGDIFTLTKLVEAGLKQRDSYATQLEASRAGCD